MSFKDFAMQEFKAAGWLDESKQFTDPMQRKLCEHVLRLLEVFDAEGHSGTSAPYALDVFKKLASFEPLVPLSGNDDEWTEYADGRFQNKRCGHVFKDDAFNGKAYDSEGRVFIEILEDGAESAFTSIESRVPVVFPYTPTRVRVNVGHRRP